MCERHTLSILVKNEPGVLTKIAQMFYRRGYNIETLTVGKTQYKNLSKIILSVPLQARDVEYLRRRITNLQDVCQASILCGEGVLQSEVCLVRVAYESENQRHELMNAAHPYRPRVRAVERNTVTLEISAHPAVVDSFVATLSPYSIQDVSRTGMTALETERERQAFHQATTWIEDSIIETENRLQGGRS